MPKRWTDDANLVNSLAENLLDAMTVFPRQMIRTDELTHAFGMPMSHIQMLIMLAGNDLTISELAMRTGIAKPNITPIVDALCEKKLIERIRSTEDRRVVNLHLLDAGQQCVAGFRENMAQQAMKWPVKYSRSEIRELNAALMTLIRLGRME